MAALIALTVVVPAIAAIVPLATASASAADPCAAPTNPVVCENSKPGSPPSQWDVGGADDPSLQGFGTDISVNLGGTISFKIKASVPYTITIFRLGYYQGNGARQITTLTPTARTQPACIENTTLGLVDCGNWAVSASWTVPTTLVSGVYIAYLKRNDTGGDSEIPFVVRDDSSHSDIVYQTSDPTWEAYNTYGDGSDFYTGTTNNGYGRASKLSYNRPFNTRGDNNGRDFLFSNEYPMLRFLESNGYDVSYIAGVDTDRNGALLKNHKIFTSTGHDEYWSLGQRTNVEAARDAGVNLAFFSGNEVYWKTRYEASIDGSNTAYRTLVSYKETWDNAKSDPSSLWTGTWRDPRFSPPADGNRPENALTGTMYKANTDDLAIQVPAAEGKARFWRNTSVASQSAGQTATLAPHTVGYESDEDFDNGVRPAGLVDLSTTVGSTPQYLTDFGSVVVPGTTTHHMTMYRAPSGALVFGAGTIQYAWALDTYHDGPATTNDPALRQATVNLLADMKAQPLTLNSGLVAASASSDTVAPTVTVTSPSAGAVLANGAQVTLSGTAADSGGVVAGVEASVDGGLSWHPTTGTTAWSYSFYATGSGAVNLRVRATDDSGNTSAPVSVAVTVNCPCSLFGNKVPVTTSAADNTDLELGIRFQTSVDGFVSGIRFYKGSANTGTHVGTLWSSSGAVLATGTFTGESATGWQSLTFANPVPVTAGTTYTASYRAPNGGYAADPLVFSANAWLASPLTALRSSANLGTGNGVFGPGGTFPVPASSYADTNYYVDVSFSGNANTPPSVISTSPVSGSTGAPKTATASATFNVAIQSGATMSLTGPGSTAVPGSSTLDGTGRVLTFTPSSALSTSTAYTVTVSGARSTTGLAMTAPFSWTFTTAAPCPCSVLSTSATPPAPDSGDGAAISVGMQFVPASNGSVTGVRFYKASTNSGTHTGSLWSSTGTRLATGTFTGETASGWQTLTFSSPVNVTAGTTYVVSYYAPNGHYSATSSYFASSVVNGPLTAPGGANGVYLYGSDAFPSGSYLSTNYWVDVVYSDTVVVPRSTPPVITAVAAKPSGTSASITWTTDEPASSVVSYGASASSLTGSATAAGNVSAHQVVITGLSPSTSYYYRVTSVDPFSNTATSPASTASAASLTTTGCPCSLFSTAQAPASPDSGDAAAIEVGVNVVPANNGYISGVSFYKSAANTGTHTGSLWSSAGVRLATGTFTGESASGWQTLTFSSPVAVSAGSTYTASYYAPNGHYSATTSYFAAAVVAGPLTAPATGNGAYRYGSGGGFPNSSYSSTNYWVDVAYSPDLTPPVISSVAAAPAGTSAGITWTTDKPSTSVVSYGTSATSLTSTTTVSTLTTAHSVGVVGLATGTTYYYRVSSVDGSGNTTTSPVSTAPAASFATTACPCSVLSTALTPTLVDSGDTAPVELGMKFVPSVNGSITGVRFYKAAANTGTHTGSVWSATGTRLATGTFTGETASGWQTLTLSTPLPVTAGTTYVVSYFSPNGHYSATTGYFNAALVSGPLTAPAGSNGVYLYAAASGFPASTYQSTNYFVDVVFTSP